MVTHLVKFHHEEIGLRKLTDGEAKTWRIKSMDKEYQKKYKVVDWDEFYRGNLSRISWISRVKISKIFYYIL